MNILRKIIILIKNLFVKQYHLNKTSTSENNIQQNSKTIFVESLKTLPIKNKKEIETLICKGDGLEIQNKISY